ncbi:specifically androgen-regulated gene protein [Sciurus carolinensis]|uniref:specifically androgen-regulated gene protein n=1 Tax=Sciurus carolinensis TaxID=30640 RepID=UPI001FB289DC|nr:specifically androgen-regulated gene protein [Sciurus carolinensis]
MPERELWPARPGSEPVTCIRSCDSMMSATSTRSGSSDSSYDFLSAEEKECLLFLEETIGSLDIEADSGLSTDESEPATTPRSFQALPVAQLDPQRNSEKTIIQQGPEPRRVTQSSSFHPREPHSLGFKSGSYSLPRNIHIGRNQYLKKSTTQTDSHFPGESKGPLAEPKKKQTSQSKGPSQAPADPQGAALDLDVVLIPPPVAFQDAQPEQDRKDNLPKGPGEHRPQLHPPFSSLDRVEPDSETMSHAATGKGSTGGAGHPQPPLTESSWVARAEDTSLPPGADPNSRVAPLTAPKPRKLPPNIVLKSSRSSFHSDPQNWLSRHTEAGDSGLVSSSLQEQRKARREALEKLGLPQDPEEPNLPLSRPTSSFRLKESQGRGPSPAPTPAPAQPSAPAPIAAVAPAAEKIPAQGSSPVKPPAPALTQGPSPGKVWIPAQEPSLMKVTKSTPIPIPKAPKANSGLSQPKPDSGLTLQESNIPGLRQMNFKSNTLERSGVGLSSYLSAEKDPSPKTSTSLGKGSFLDKISPSVLRNSRPRPASLGTGKDFAAIQVGKLKDLEQDQSSKRLSYQGQSHDKLPRPPCVSVKISPKGIPDEHRREALKKLGLLKE